MDPGFAEFGYAVARIEADREVVIEMGLIETEKSDKKQKVHAVEDNARRAQEIARELYALVKKYRPYALSAEAFSPPRHASVAGKMGLTWGVIMTLAELTRMPVLQVTPQMLKRVVCPTIKGASKAEIIAAIQARYPGCESTFASRIPPSKWEHPFDALGTIVATLNGETIRAARRMVVCSPTQTASPSPPSSASPG